MKSFEERLKRLEEINQEIANGSLGLNESVRNFELGIQLAKSLEKELARIEKRVEILNNRSDEPEESPNLELFSGFEETPE